MCENLSAGHLGARLIQPLASLTAKESPRLRLRFQCCVPTTASSVFTQPRPKADTPDHQEKASACCAAGGAPGAASLATCSQFAQPVIEIGRFRRRMLACLTCQRTRMEEKGV